MQGIWLPNATYLGTHTTPPPRLQYKVPAQRSFPLVSRNQTILRKARAWAFLMAGIPSGKDMYSEKAADSVITIHSPLPLLFQGLFSLRGRTIPSWRPCLPQYTPSFAPNSLPPEPSGLTKRDEQKEYVATCRTRDLPPAEVEPYSGGVQKGNPGLACLTGPPGKPANCQGLCKLRQPASHPFLPQAGGAGLSVCLSAS